MNFHAIARQAAARYGLDANIFERQINQESGFNPHITSRAGARGIAQFMPATAAGLGINPDNPVQALNGAAKLMAGYVHKFGNYHDALVAYNAGEGRVGKPLYPETANYVKTILGGHAGSTNAGVQLPAEQPSSGNATVAHAASTNVKQAFVDALLEHPKNLLKDVAYKVGTGAYTTPAYTNTVKRDAAPPSAAFPQAGGKAGQVSIGPGANRKGANIVPEVLSFARQLAGIVGQFTIGTGTNHNRLTVDGNVSDHWDGHAVDIPVPTDSHRGDQIAAAALTQAGVPPAKARTMARNGGLFNVNMNGHRVQIIWKTYEGGNHHNHVHIGIR